MEEDDAVRFTIMKLVDMASLTTPIRDISGYSRLYDACRSAAEAKE